MISPSKLSNFTTLVRNNLSKLIKKKKKNRGEERSDNTTFEAKLPPELWLKIAQNMWFKELSHLSRTCRYLLQILRPELFFCVLLDPDRDREAVSLVIQLLKQNTTLAGHIHILHFRNLKQDAKKKQKKKRDGSKIYIPYAVDAILNMSRLTALDITFPIFRDAEEQERFVRAIRDKKIPLRNINVSEVDFPSDDFGIPGLKSVLWNVINKDKILWSVLEASQETLEAILISPVTRAGVNAPLWKMRFPQIRDILLYDWSMSDFLQLEDFFIVHHENLTFRFGPYQSNMIFSLITDHPEGSSQLGIKQLSGDPEFLQRVFQQFPTQVRHTLERFSIQSMVLKAEHWPILLSYVNRMLDTLHNDYPRPPLPKLEFPLYRLMMPPHISNPHYEALDLEAFLAQITRFIELSPNTITAWPGALPPVPGLSPERLGAAFAHATKLNIVHLSEELVKMFGGPCEYTLNLARVCPSLEEVMIESMTRKSWKVGYLRIIRDGPDNEPRISKVENLGDLSSRLVADFCTHISM